MKVIQGTPAWQLAACVENTRFGYHLTLRSFVPGARRPESQLKFSGIFTFDELQVFRDAINDVLSQDSSAQAHSIGREVL